jgi:hypothetical protein
MYGERNLASNRATSARSEDWQNQCSAQNRANNRATRGPQLNLAEIEKSWNLADHADYGRLEHDRWTAACSCLSSDSDAPSEPVSNRTRTSTPHCATSGRPARVLGSRREAVPVATGTLGDQPALALLRGRPHAQP